MAKPCGLVKPCHLVKPVSATRVAGRYLSHQKGLPSLPVPPLQQTCERYITALEPILEMEELKHTKELVQEFQKAGGIGQSLQTGLEKRASKAENWVSSFERCRFELHFLLSLNPPSFYETPCACVAVGLVGAGCLP